MDTFNVILCIILSFGILFHLFWLLYDILKPFLDDNRKKIRKHICVDCLYQSICKHYNDKRYKPCLFIKKLRKHMQNILKHHKIWL